jgi:hypothetical protein
LRWIGLFLYFKTIPLKQASFAGKKKSTRDRENGRFRMDDRGNLKRLRTPTIHAEQLTALKDPPRLKPTMQMPIAEKTAASPTNSPAGKLKPSPALVAFH